MNPDVFHINLYHVAAMATLFSGFTLALLLAFAKRKDQAANLFLSAALAVIVLKTGGLSPIFLPALGPLLYFYVRRMTSPNEQFGRKEILHFCPLVIANWIPGWLVLISIVVYLYLSYRLIQHFYNRLQPVLMDKPRFAFRQLEKALQLLGFICGLWLFNDALGFAFAFLLIGMAAEVMLRSDNSVKLAVPVTDRYDIKDKSRRIKEAVAANRFYEDAELTLNTLAIKLNIHPHELSRIINVGMEKNFSDFINEFRVRETVRKMLDPACERLTLLGIANESGFNSKTTFNRVFKEMTGKTPVEYKNDLKKEVPIDKLAPRLRILPVILRPENPLSWAPAKLNRNYMFRNYIKIAWRNLLKNKFYSFINIAGLTAGLAIGILILLWVQDELSFDGFHKQAGNIYKIEAAGGTDASAQISTSIVAPIGPAAKRQLPGVLDYVRLSSAGNFSLYKFGDKVFTDEKVTYADPSLFKVFDFRIIEGNPAKPFITDNSIVITKETAEKYFGTANPIGKVISADDRFNFTVSAVIGNFPKNSSISYDMIIPMSFHIKFMLAQHVDLNTNFDFYAYETYLLLKPGIDPQSLAGPIKKIHLSFRAEDTDGNYLLLPITKMHLYNADLTDKGISTVRIFILIALLTLVIACINYVNLSTARSMLRAKEISMRKIVGAAKAQLFAQFITETALLFLIACLLAFGLMVLLMPMFNQLSGKQLTLNLFNYQVWMVVLAAIIGTLAASSIYPALLLSSFDPLKALKGKISVGIGDALFRKILVITQFTFSVVLIVGTIVITSQLRYIHSKQLGYDKSHTLTFRMKRMGLQYDAVMAELLKQPGVLGITRSNVNIVNMFLFGGDNDWEGKLPGQVVVFHGNEIDKDFISFFKMKIIKGADFTGAVADSAHFILNETAVKQLGMKNPIGQWFRMGRTKGTIIGVVKDFHFASMKEKIGPAVFHYDPDHLGTIYIKTSGQYAPKVIAAAAKQFKQYNSPFPFNYKFLDDVFDSLYQSEQREGTLFNYFAVIAIFISCLGLLGLAAYTAQVRTREIGVRKVLGAGVSGIVGLLAGDFIKLVLIAILIATPIAWFTMNKWLQDYAYRITLGWQVFAWAGFIAGIVAIMTVIIQSVKAALANPVKSLRVE